MSYRRNRFKRKKGIQPGKTRKKTKPSYKNIVMESKGECRFAELMDSVGIPWDYECEVFEWIPPVKKYRPDFRFPAKNNHKIHIEYKGYFRPEDRTKMNHTKRQFPEIDFRLVFENASRTLPGSKTTYGEWAERHAIPWVDLNIKRHRRTKTQPAWVEIDQGAIETIKEWFRNPKKHYMHWDDRVRIKRKVKKK